MANLPTESEGKPPSPLREVHPVFRWMGAVDDTLFSIEKAFVTGSLVIMTLAIFLKISNDFIHKQLLVINGETVVGSPVGAFVALGVLLVFAFVGGWVSAQQTERFSDSVGKTALVALGGTAVAFLFGLLVVKAESSTVCVVLAVIAGVILINHTITSRRAAGEEPFGASAMVSIGLALLMVGGIIYASRGFEGYSWADSVSLTLLLWMAFFGASMATYERRHLAIDAIRKAVPKHRLRMFNAVSYLLTALATAALLYLSALYFDARIGEETEPGKVPDSWKVLSIPVALSFVTLRFFFYAIAEFIMSMMGFEPEDENAMEEVA